MNTDKTYQDVIDVLGLEVYNVYKEEKHAITETIILGIVTSIIFEFLKGVVNFEKLGDSLKQKFESFLERLRKKKGHELDDETKKEATEILRIIIDIKITFDSREFEEGHKSVYQYLLSLGMSQKIAEKKAISIVSSLEKNLTN